MASRKDPLLAVEQAREGLLTAQAAYRVAVRNARSEGVPVRLIAQAARVTRQQIYSFTASS